MLYINKISLQIRYLDFMNGIYINLAIIQVMLEKYAVINILNSSNHQ